MLFLVLGCASGLHFRPALCIALVSLAPIVVNCIAMHPPPPMLWNIFVLRPRLSTTRCCHNQRLMSSFRLYRHHLARPEVPLIRNPSAHSPHFKHFIRATLCPSHFCYFIRDFNRFALHYIWTVRPFNPPRPFHSIFILATNALLIIQHNWALIS